MADTGNIDEGDRSIREVFEILHLLQDEGEGEYGFMSPLDEEPETITITRLSNSSTPLSTGD